MVLDKKVDFTMRCHIEDVAVRHNYKHFKICDVCADLSHQSASHLGISSVSQVAASAAQVFASPCVLQFVFVAALRLE